MRALPLLVVLSVSACHRERSAPAAPATTADQDALWKLAPAGTKLGLVASSRGLTMTEHAWGDVRAFIAATPELAPLLVKLAEIAGTPDLSLASFGLTAAKGAALFLVDSNHGVVVVPLGDRDKFLAAVHGTKGEPIDTIDKDMICTTTHGVYACASDKAMFDQLGGAGLDASPAGARGDLELVAHDFPIHGKPGSFALVAQLERGAVTVRGSVAGMPDQVINALGDASQPQLENEHITGFGIGHLKGVLATIPDDPDGKALFGVTERDLIGSIGEPLAVTTTSSSFDFKLPLTNPAPAKTILIDHCVDGPLKAVHGTLVAGACHFEVPYAPGLGLDLWIDGNALHLGDRSAPAGDAVPLSPIGTEIASKSWQIALYGRGSLLALSRDLNAYRDQLKNLPPELLRFIRPIERALVFLNETALAIRTDGNRLSFLVHVRTAWSNPDDVVAKLLALDPDAAIAGKGLELVRPIVTAAPDSPLATDVRAGYLGILPAPFVAGIAAAAAIPALAHMNPPEVPAPPPPVPAR